MIRLNDLKERFIGSLTDDTKRISNQFIWIYIILFLVAMFMSVINILTSKTALMYSTLTFALLCVINVILARFTERGLKLSSILLAIEIVALFIFFIVSGTPEGFSAIWICLLPSSGMLLYKRRNGSILCALMFAVLIFFFETPFGRSLLQYRYTDSFMLRFPMLYLAFCAISFFLETVRSITYDKMTRLQSQYEHLYTHDALTGLYNRYGFNEHLERLVKQSEGQKAALMILDIDHFKNVNDRYGHINGDAALKQISDFLKSKCADSIDVCRWGGEEFAILLSDGQDADTLAERLRSDVQGFMIKLPDGDISVTASIGVAIGEMSKTLDAEALISAADKCLFSAKNDGRNKVVSVKIMK